jgi:hypothetical protein
MFQIGREIVFYKVVDLKLVCYRDVVRGFLIEKHDFFSQMVREIMFKRDRSHQIIPPSMDAFIFSQRLELVG